MRDKLRTFLRHHRGHKDAEWAMAEADLKPLDNVFAMLQPTGVEDRVRWLFRPGAVELRPDFDWNKQQAELGRPPKTSWRSCLRISYSLLRQQSRCITRSAPQLPKHPSGAQSSAT